MLLCFCIILPYVRRYLRKQFCLLERFVSYHALELIQVRPLAVGLRLGDWCRADGEEQGSERSHGRGPHGRCACAFPSVHSK